MGIKVASLADAVLACHAIFSPQRDNAHCAIREERLHDKHLQGMLALRAYDLNFGFYERYDQILGNYMQLD